MGAVILQMVLLKSVFSNLNNEFSSFKKYYLNKVFVNQALSLSQFNDKEILETANKIKSNSIGPDGIPGYIFRGCINELLTPLKIIFNISLTTGTFPKIWKMSRICPIFKSGNRSSIENYRAISILCFSAKLFESLI